MRAAEAVATRAPKSGASGDGWRRNDHLDEIAERLGDRLNTRVKVSLGATRGQIVIDFATIHDLNRILTRNGPEPSYS